MNQALGVIQSSQFVQFVYLQALDLLSTIAFLLHGVGEANPLVRWSFRVAPTPVLGLFAVKLLGLALAYYCIISKRERLLSKINLFYAGLIAWNLLCLVLSTQV